MTSETLRRAKSLDKKMCDLAQHFADDAQKLFGNDPKNQYQPAAEKIATANFLFNSSPERYQPFFDPLNRQVLSAEWKIMKQDSEAVVDCINRIFEIVAEQKALQTQKKSAPLKGTLSEFVKFLIP